MSRGRALTATQVAHIQDQHVRNDVRFDVLAAEYNVSRKTIAVVIARRGAYAIPGASSISAPRGRKRGLDHAQADCARRRYVDEDASPTVLAYDLGVTVSTMLAVLKCTGAYADDGPGVKEPTERYHGHQKLTDENVRELRRLRSDGVTYEEIAIRFQVDSGTVMNAVKGKNRFALIDPAPENAVVSDVQPETRRALLVAKVEQMLLAGRSAAQVVDFVTLGC